MAKKKDKSPVQLGAEREERYRNLKISQGHLSFIRARKTRFGKYDIWEGFDVLSMNADGYELAQIKGDKPRSARMNVVRWIQANRDKIPENCKLVVALEQKDMSWRIIKVEVQNVEAGEYE